MLAIWATFIKELTELRRDRAGLLVLLVMPMTLLVIISLVQDSVMKSTGEAPVRVLFVDQDRSFLGAALTQQLQRNGGLETITRLHQRDLDEATGRDAVARGDYQVCLVIAPGTGNALRQRIARLTAEAWAGGRRAGKPAAASALAGVALYFDPAVQGILRTAVINALYRVLLGIEARERAQAMTKTTSQEIKKMMNAAASSAEEPHGGPAGGLTMGMDPLLTISAQSAAAGSLMKWPTAAQQNVPGWALFGMFFIVVPISGVLVRERQTGTFLRLMTMPVSPLNLLAGKVGAYLLVCLAQFALMLLAGCYLLPLLGITGLEAGASLLQVVPIAVAASLAATGFGLMVGTLAKTYEQASMFGAVSIVIAAAVGGVMVPTYVMPHVMREISNLSPLAWGLTAFQDIFVRGGNLGTVWPQLSYLALFFAVTIAVSGFFLRGSRRE